MLHSTKWACISTVHGARGEPQRMFWYAPFLASFSTATLAQHAWNPVAKTPVKYAHHSQTQ